MPRIVAASRSGGPGRPDHLCDDPGWSRLEPGRACPLPPEMRPAVRDLPIVGEAADRAGQPLLIIRGVFHTGRTPSSPWSGRAASPRSRCR